MATVPGVGARLLGRLVLEQLLEAGDRWALYLADDTERAELLLALVADTTEVLDAELPKLGAAVRRTPFGPWVVAEIALDERHVLKWGDKLLTPSVPRIAPTAPAPTSSLDQQLADGSTFAERYRVEGLLGRGGMGEVYRAYDDVLRRPVALKIVRVDRLGDADTGARVEAKKRLLEEARFVSALKHPHIVELFDAGEVGGVPYLVLEFCEGGNLRAAIAKADTSRAEMHRWLREIASALAFAHAKGIVHRDLKPENVLVTSEGVVKLADFGIAKAFAGEHTRGHTTAGIIGTPRYMAPEQLIGNRVDGRADQFAWALLAQELLTGIHPRLDRTGEASSESLRATGEISRAMFRVLRRASSGDPRARYAYFPALLKELDEAQTSRWLPIAFGVVAAATCSAAAVGVYRHGRSRPTVPPQVSVTVAFDARAVDADMLSRCNAGARPAFSAGLQLWRDASEWEALSRFDEVIDADPTCAVASLYYVMAATHTYPRRREHYRRAREQRRMLNERETSLLDCQEPILGDPPDLEESLRRTTRLVERTPADVDALRLHAIVLNRLKRYEQTLAALRGADVLLPAPVPELEFLKAMTNARLRKSEETAEHFARCLRASPDSANCLQWKALLLASQGKCGEAESSLRKLVSVMPRSAQAQLTLGHVLLETTQDARAARPYFEARWNLADPTAFRAESSPEASRFADEMRLSVIGGDLASGLANQRSWLDSSGVSTNGRFRGEPLLQLLYLLRELGYDDEARERALDGLHEQRGWTEDDLYDTQIELPRAAYVIGAIDANEYRRYRDAWLVRRPRAPAEVWVKAYAGLGELASEMAIPVAPGEYALDWLQMSPEYFARAADEFAEVGRYGDAIRHAEAAAGCCLAYFPMGNIHSQMSQAKAYDRARQVSKACVAYSRFVEHFGKNKSSVSVSYARRRTKLLHCNEL